MHARAHHIIEVAVLTCDWTGQVLDRFETLVRPDGLAPTDNRAEMLAEAPGFAEIAGDLLACFSGRVVAGHNVSLALRFIDFELARIRASLPRPPYVCTRELATLLGCDVPNLTFAALCVDLDI